MWKFAAIGFVLVGTLCPIATGILRRRAYDQRVQRGELGSTQDIAMWGTLAGLGFLAAALVCIIVHGCRNDLIVWYDWDSLP